MCRRVEGGRGGRGVGGWKVEEVEEGRRVGGWEVFAG